MIQTYDFFNHAEMPSIVLCNPNKDELYSLSQFIMQNDKLTLKFNGLSEYEFSVPSSIDGGVTKLEFYDLIQAKRVIYIGEIGYFVIYSVTELTDGQSPYKEVKCRSLEAELISKKITSLTGTLKFYDPFHLIDNVMDLVLTYVPSWSIGYIDPVIEAKYRTFNVTDSTVYSFLLNDVANTFECIFKFDTVNKTISAYSLANSTTGTDIYLSFENLIKKSEFTEISDEIVTALSVYGGNKLSIRGVNPLGTNIIYNFDYYKNTQWMTQDLIDAINAWEAQIAFVQPSYAANLTALKLANQDLIDLIYNPTTGLNKLKAELSTLESQQQVAVTAVPPNPTLIASIAAQITAKEAEITAKEAAIALQQIDVDTLESSLQAVNDSLSFANNFTETQLANLSLFIFENTYISETIVALDSMTPDEYQDAAQTLYNQAVDVLSRASQPRYEFNVNTANFVAMPEFVQFTGQLVLGAEITVNISEDYDISTVLLQIETSFNNPSNFNLSFSNRLRLDNGNYQYSDILGKVSSTSTTVSSNVLVWDDWSTNYKDEVSTFINSALDAATNNVVNSSNQEMVMNAYGLRGRKEVSPGIYDPKEMWLTNNILAFTDDNWQTSKIALGTVQTPNGTFSGLVADQIVGRLLAGNSLTITNDDGSGVTKTFTLDQNGAILTNADFTIQNNLSKIILDPTNGIKIQRNTTPGFNVTKELNTTKIATGVSSTSFFYTVSNISDRLLVLTIGSNSGNVTSATFGAQNFTKLTSINNPVGNKPISEIWYLVAPTIGTNTINVVFSGSSFVEVGATTYFNVNQTSPFSTPVTNYGNSNTISQIISSNTSDLVIDTLCYWTGVATVGVNQTQIYNITSDGSWKSAASYEIGSASSVMSWSISSSVDYSYIAVSINAVSAPTPVFTDVFYVDTSGNLVFSGNLSGVGGTFSGELVAASGTFSGNLSAAGGTFAGDISAATGTFSGSIIAASGLIGNWSIDADGLVNNFAAPGSQHIWVYQNGDSDTAIGNFVVVKSGTYDWARFDGDDFNLILTDYVYMQADNYLHIRTPTLYIDNGTGVDVGQTVTINTNLNPTLIFSNGILVGYF